MKAASVCRKLFSLLPREKAAAKQKIRPLSAPIKGVADHLERRFSLLHRLKNPFGMQIMCNSRRHALFLQSFAIQNLRGGLKPFLHSSSAFLLFHSGTAFQRHSLLAGKISIHRKQTESIPLLAYGPTEAIRADTIRFLRTLYHM